MSDPKPPERGRDRAITRRKLVADRECRGCGSGAAEGHHILLRSLGGDDLADNIAPLCTYCHLVFHGVRNEDAKAIGREIGITIKPVEMGYLVAKLGGTAAAVYLLRYYGVTYSSWKQKHGEAVYSAEVAALAPGWAEARRRPESEIPDPPEIESRERCRGGRHDDPDNSGLCVRCGVVLDEEVA